MTSLKKIRTPKPKNFFFIGNYKTCRVFGFSSSHLKLLWLRLHSPGTDRSLGKIRQLSDQHKTQVCSRSPTNICNYDNSDRNCAQHSTDCRDDYYRHTGIAYHVAYNAQGTMLHHGFSPLISVECACVKHYP